jgi:hypothetical protein
MPVTTDHAFCVADRWYAAWNARSVERVLACYASDAELLSPLVGAVMGCRAERVRGRGALAEYLTLVFRRFPDLHLEPQLVLVGADGLSLHYHMLGMLVVTETLELDAGLRIVRAAAHFATTLLSDREAEAAALPACRRRPGASERRPGWRAA